jgi:hypothetical protein
LRAALIASLTRAARTMNRTSDRRQVMVMPVVLLLLVVLAVLALFLERGVSDKDEAKDSDPPSKNPTR